MRVLTTAEESLECAGCVLVPTMGALHAGHGRLIREAMALADGRDVVVSVFVNPTQFNDPTDLARYPRTFDADVTLARESGAQAVFAPAEGVVYPVGRTDRVPVLPDVATAPGLEDRWRPGHFAGVAQVVSRLFELLRPDMAVFGEKDWQQLQVIRAIAERDFGGVRIVGVETVREASGLAMSSRNAHLGGSDRDRAAVIARALCEACGESDVGAGEARMTRMLRDAGLEVEYAAIRESRTLLPWVAGSGEGRALIAARCGGVRLIDNAPWRAAR